VASAAIGAGYAAEPELITIIALQDAVQCHELEVVGVCAYAQVRGAKEGFSFQSMLRMM